MINGNLYMEIGDYGYELGYKLDFKIGNGLIKLGLTKGNEWAQYKND